MPSTTSDIREVRDAYNATGGSWGDGPVRLYGRLADELLGHSPVDLDGQSVLDVGAGSGAVSSALLARGARPTQLDFAIGMLLGNRTLGLPAANGDVTLLPFRSSSFDGAAAGFCLNHLPDPVAGFRELARVVRPGGVVLSSTFGTQPHHPAKTIVDAVAARHGFEVPPWYQRMKSSVEGLLATVDATASAARAAGLPDAVIVETTVDCGIDTPAAMAAYRTGMAHLAPFMAGLSDEERDRARAEMERELEGVPPVRPTIILLAAVVRRG